ncbi:helix-turn-helix transcriptional regulator [Knoellia aerolata]|uniref:helix-turn-helix transcriptional regulator n=1 Tax=Knoellia aerolata TaxID=442954 RepID=UPI00068E0140|nr:response regulator transcription factor [Knoellia aerolata]
MSPARDRPVSVAVVNDHELIVRGVASMLTPYADLVRVVELDADLMPVSPVDVALYDTFTHTSLDEPDLDDLAQSPRIGRLVLYTWVLTEELVVTARARGVHSALPKSLDGASLAAALVKVHEGAPHLATVPDEPVMASQSWPGRDHGLTPRESEIIALVTSGLSNNEIAERTYLSINSVKSYIRSAYRTMGVTTRSQAVLWGIDHGMAPTRMRVLLPPTPAEKTTVGSSSAPEVRERDG